MIKGIGIDIAYLPRFLSFIDDISKIKKILSNEEYEEFSKITNEQRKLDYLGGRFSSKEAFIKASNSYGITFSYTDISIINNEDGAPNISFAFSFNDKVHLSISHDNDYAISYIVIEA